MTWYYSTEKKNTDAACCPDINIEDVVLSHKIGDIAENTSYTKRFVV